MSPRNSKSRRPSVDYPEPPLSDELEIELPTGATWGLCLSHDIDHFGLRDHLFDGFMPRHAYHQLHRNLRQNFRPLRAADGLLGIALAYIGIDRWDVVDALREAEREAGVQATWFMAVRRGLGINYSDDEMGKMARHLADAGLEVGLHGQSPNDADALAQEARDLAEMAGQPIEGLRMHYLRMSPAVFEALEKADLRYDTTVMDRGDHAASEHPLPAPRRIRGGRLEIPLHVMDSTLFSRTGMALDLRGATEYVLNLADRARELGRVLTLNLHPNNYSRQDPDIRDWYDDILHRLTDRSDVFITDFRGLVPRIEQR